MSIIEEERLCSSYAGHSVKGNSTKSVSFFVLAFEEKSAKRPHLLAGFSVVLGFPSYILCLFVDGVWVFYLYSLLFAFQRFHTFLSRKPIIKEREI